MDMTWISIILAVAMIVLLSFGVWVSFTLIAIGGIGLILSENYQVGMLFSTGSWGAATSWSLTALPLFIWMGEVLFRTKLSEDLFKGLAPWLGKVPGKLLHVNILSCGIFAAVSGSSAATAATIGRMTLPELRKQGYSERMAIGTLAGSGTLGLLIPPSIILIVYGVAAEVSIARLFIAGALPGVLLICLFMGFTMIWGRIHKDELPSSSDQDTSWPTRLKSLRKLLPVLGLIWFCSWLYLWRSHHAYRSRRYRRYRRIDSRGLHGFAHSSKFYGQPTRGGKKRLHDWFYIDWRALSYVGNGLFRHTDRTRPVDCLPRFITYGLNPLPNCVFCCLRLFFGWYFRRRANGCRSTSYGQSRRY